MQIIESFLKFSRKFKRKEEIYEFPMEVFCEIRKNYEIKFYERRHGFFRDGNFASGFIKKCQK